MKGPKNLEFYLSEFSSDDISINTLNKRDVNREKKIFVNYLSSLGGEWLSLIERFANQYPLMSSAVRAVIFVPARNEEKRIVSFLSSIEKELAELSKCAHPIIELYILNNRKENDSNDCTCSAVEEYLSLRKSKFPVLYFEHLWSSNEIHCIALARKILADTAIFRACDRKIANGPLYLLTEDADITDIDLGRTESMIKYLDNNPQIDAIRGLQERTRWALAKNQLLLLERKSWFFTEIQLSSKNFWPNNWDEANFYWNRVVTGGWNTCFSAESYALIKGYTKTVRIFEDMDIGQRISVMRGRWKGKKFIPDVSTVARFPARAESRVSRAILSLSEKRHLYDDRNNYEFFYNSDCGKLIRNCSEKELLKKIDRFTNISNKNIYRFEEVLTVLWIELIEILNNVEIAKKIFKRTMFFLGFTKNDFLLKNDKINLLNWSKFNFNARKYSLRYRNKINAE